MPKITNTFKKRVLSRLNEMGWVKSDLAKALGQKSSGIYTYLSEDGPAPGIEVLERWAAVLECDPAWLISENESISEPLTSLATKKLALISVIIAADNTRITDISFRLNRYLDGGINKGKDRTSSSG